MDIPIQILVTGLTMGSMYALAAVGLSLIFGTLGMFNMAHGMFMTAGAYVVFSLVAVRFFHSLQLAAGKAALRFAGAKPISRLRGSLRIKRRGTLLPPPRQTQNG